jgi:hypothetical protein
MLLDFIKSHLGLITQEFGKQTYEKPINPPVPKLNLKSIKPTEERKQKVPSKKAESVVAASENTALNKAVLYSENSIHQLFSSVERSKWDESAQRNQEEVKLADINSRNRFDTQVKNRVHVFNNPLHRLHKNYRNHQNDT